MRSIVFLGVALLLLTACGGTSLQRSNPGTPERACEDAADSDPKVRDFNATTGVNGNPLDFSEDYKAARNAAVVECMRIRDGRPKGGVEKVIR